MHDPDDDPSEWDSLDFWNHAGGLIDEALEALEYVDPGDVKQGRALSEMQRELRSAKRTHAYWDDALAWNDFNN